MTDPQTIAEGMTRAQARLLAESEPGAFGNMNEGTGAGILGPGDIMAARALVRKGLGDVFENFDMYPPRMFFANRLGLAVRTHLEKESKK